MFFKNNSKIKRFVFLSVIAFFALSFFVGIFDVKEAMAIEASGCSGLKSRPVKTKEQAEAFAKDWRACFFEKDSLFTVDNSYTFKAEGGDGIAYAVLPGDMVGYKGLVGRPELKFEFDTFQKQNLALDIDKRIFAFRSTEYKNIFLLTFNAHDKTKSPEDINDCLVKRGLVVIPDDHMDEVKKGNGLYEEREFLKIALDAAQTRFPPLGLFVEDDKPVQNLGLNVKFDVSFYNSFVYKVHNMKEAIEYAVKNDGVSYSQEVIDRFDKGEFVFANICPAKNFLNLEKAEDAGGENASDSEVKKGTCPSDTKTRSLLEFFKGDIGTGMACFLLNFIAGIGDFIMNFLDGGSKVTGIMKLDKIDDNQFLVDTWKFIRSIVNIVFLIGFLIAALFNVASVIGLTNLGGKADQWNINKMMMNIVTSVILVNFSLAICNVGIDVANVLTETFLGGATGLEAFIEKGTMGDIGGEKLWQAFFNVVTYVILAGFLVYIYILMYVRVIVISILVMFSGVPYIGKILPFEQVNKLVGKWSGEFTKWLFNGPMIALFLWIIARAINNFTLPPIDISAGVTYIGPSIESINHHVVFENDISKIRNV